MGITLEDAQELLKEKQEAEAKRVIKTFDENPDLQILNGRYGPYISYQKKELQDSGKHRSCLPEHRIMLQGDRSFRIRRRKTGKPKAPKPKKK